jgi:hypothetical protein
LSRLVLSHGKLSDDWISSFHWTVFGREKSIHVEGVTVEPILSTKRTGKSDFGGKTQFVEGLVRFIGLTSIF